MKCNQCLKESNRIGIRIQDVCVCADCMMKAFLEGKNYLLANELNNSMAVMGEGEAEHTWLYFKHT